MTWLERQKDRPYLQRSYITLNSIELITMDKNLNKFEKNETALSSYSIVFVQSRFFTQWFIIQIILIINKDHKIKQKIKQREKMCKKNSKKITNPKKFIFWSMADWQTDKTMYRLDAHMSLESSLKNSDVHSIL